MAGASRLQARAQWPSQEKAPSCPQPNQGQQQAGEPQSGALRGFPSWGASDASTPPNKPSSIPDSVSGHGADRKDGLQLEKGLESRCPPPPCPGVARRLALPSEGRREAPQNRAYRHDIGRPWQVPPPWYHKPSPSWPAGSAACQHSCRVRSGSAGRALPESRFRAGGWQIAAAAAGACAQR